MLEFKINQFNVNNEIKKINIILFQTNADHAVASQMFARYIDAVLSKHNPISNLSTDGRSNSGHIFKPPTYVDDTVICTATSSSSLNAIQSTEGQSNTTTSIFTVFKRVGSYSPARRQKKNAEKMASTKENGPI